MTTEEEIAFLKKEVENLKLRMERMEMQYPPRPYYSDAKGTLPIPFPAYSPQPTIGDSVPF